MKAVYVFVAILICGAFADDLYDQFLDWCMEHNKVYNSAEEHVSRFNAFKRNVALIHHLNRHSKTATFGLNKFSDLSQEEFAAKYLNTISITTSGFSLGMDTFEYDHSIQYPAEKNWLRDGAVTPVKDQGNCGSCWAFSSTGTMEGATFLHSKVLPSISEQQLVDCTRETECVESGGQKYCNHGCKGGNEAIALIYAHNRGMVSEQDYPYAAVDQTCMLQGKQIRYHFRMPLSIYNNENAMIAALNEKGPLSIGVDSTYWHQYHSGIFDDAFTKGKINHAVLLVGYGSENGVGFWLVKNSWGTQWGIEGYIKVIRGTGKNSCNIQDFVVAIDAE